MEILNYISNHIHYVVTFFEHLFYTFCSLHLMFWLRNHIKVLISKYRNEKDYSNLKVEFNYNFNNIKLDIVNFDGYNYIFRLEIDEFKGEEGKGLVWSTGQYKPYILHMKSKDISSIDILKIIFLKNIKLSKETSSNIIRVLMNNEKIK